MVQCAAFGCKNNNSDKVPNRSWHSFPKDESRREAWINAVRRDEWKPSERSKLCSDHFEDTCFRKTATLSRCLNFDAVPTIFNFSAHLKIRKKLKERSIPVVKPIAKQGSNVSASPCESTSSNEEECQPFRKAPTSEDPYQKALPREIVHDHPYCAIENNDWILKKLKSSEQVAHLIDEEKEKISQDKETQLKTVEAMEAMIRRQKSELQKLRKKLQCTTEIRDDQRKIIFQLKKQIQKIKRKDKWKSSQVVKELEKRLDSFSPIALRMLNNAKKKQTSRHTYPPEVRKFAITLHAYSSKSYNYVRENLCKGLPSERTISRWMDNVSCSPEQETHSIIIRSEELPPPPAEMYDYANLIFN